ncbi:MAG: divergent polysaccharide deacetylase family protein [Alphaproteobacteria bacterium]|nr:divergent polysaccharide deacetylase family protein [Alphaproteobacteria bacterium]
MADRAAPSRRAKTARAAAAGATRKALSDRRVVSGLIAANVFAIGIGVGLGLGAIFGEAPVRQVASAMIQERPAEPAAPGAAGFRSDEGAADLELSVRVRRSERALAGFVYEEAADPPLPATLRAAPPQSVEFLDPHEAMTASARSAEPTAPLRLASLTTPAFPDKSVVRAGPAAESPAGALWRRNAASFNRDSSRPAIVVVIDDLGIDQKRTRRAIALDGALTLAFIPYGYNLRSHVAAAKAAGHEIMLHLPMEPMNPDVDPGPNALLTTLDPAQLQQRIDWALAQFSGYVGVNNHMGSRFTAWPDGMAQVAATLRKRGLLFLDSITTQDTIAYRVAARAGVPHVTRDVFLDNDLRPEAIVRALRRAELIARAHGHAVAIGHPHDATLVELAKWIPTLEGKGLQLAPISAVVATPPVGPDG